ncbi:MAG: dihydroneopterin aldolase [Cyanobacteria bacterium]|nr:dihydroneopterin aldolase [Cyanobacteriota bacterium]
MAQQALATKIYHFNAMQSAIIIRQLKLWAHVGVLNWEREFGQWFELDIWLYYDLSSAASTDQIEHTINYADVIITIRNLSELINCSTIEYFSEQIFEVLEAKFGIFPMELELKKCDAPIPAFSGVVSVKRSRNQFKRPE